MWIRIIGGIIGVLAFICGFIDLIIYIFDESTSTIACAFIGCGKNGADTILMTFFWGVVLALCAWAVFHKEDPPPRSVRIRAR